MERQVLKLVSIGTVLFPALLEV